MAELKIPSNFLATGEVVLLQYERWVIFGSTDTAYGLALVHYCEEAIAQQRTWIDGGYKTMLADAVGADRDGRLFYKCGYCEENPPENVLTALKLGVNCERS